MKTVARQMTFRVGYSRLTTAGAHPPGPKRAVGCRAKWVFAPIGIYRPAALPSRTTLEQVTVRASDEEEVGPSLVVGVSGREMGRSVAQYGERRNVDRFGACRLARHWWRGRGLCEYGTGRRGTMLRHWRIGAVVAAIMVGLVMVGLGLATASPSLAPRYWLWLVPVFGLLSVLTAWIGSPDSPRLGFRAVGRQLLHWLVIGGAVAFDFWLRGTGEEAGVTAGFDALLLLAVGCFLAGVHLEAIFALVGSCSPRPCSSW